MATELLPNANGATIQWTPTPAVDNYLNVDDSTLTSADDSATYNRATAAGKTDIYQLDALDSQARIDSVTLVGRGGSGSPGANFWGIDAYFIINGTDYLQVSRVNAQFPGYPGWANFNGSTLTTNPDTSALWTKADVDALQIKITTKTIGPPFMGSVRLTQTYAGLVLGGVFRPFMISG